MAKAVRLTESSMFALASAEMKLEILPPGHAEMRIIPMATEGGGFIRMTRTNVSAGNKKNWEKMPSRADFGCLMSFLKLSILISRATPNIMTASVIFM